MVHSHRQEKLGEQIAEDISDLIRTRVKDPRIGFVSVTRVEVSGDLRHAKVYVSVMGSPEERKETMQGLNKATGFLRHELASRLTLRYMPEITFKLDNSIEEGSRVLELINKVSREDEERKQTLEAQMASQHPDETTENID
ncbi:MAG TPA: 30S ribosome-binding factor RbfA [Ktedonobacter sp.]|nr:30S ribosome-binding factor RbfA [Ktedonobacter sp.]